MTGRINGVDLQLMENTLGSIESDSSMAKCRFRLHNRWIDGSQNSSTIAGFHAANQEVQHRAAFQLSADEPEMLAGYDTAPNPVEHLLNALAACLTSTMVYHAALRGIRIQELESDTEGELDLRGFFGMSPQIRKGYESIKVNFKVKTDQENLEKLRALSRLSPVFDVVSNGTRVDVNIEAK